MQPPPKPTTPPPEPSPEQLATIERLRSARGWGLLKRHINLAQRADTAQYREQLTRLCAAAKAGFLSFVLGNWGTGKTQLAVDLMMTYTQNLLSAEYTTAMRFFLEIKATYNKDSVQTELEVVDSFCKSRLLVIDEFEKRADSPWANTLLFEVVNDRYSMKQDTVLMSNLPEPEFRKLVGPALVDRMQETGGVFITNQKSFRK